MLVRGRYALAPLTTPLLCHASGVWHRYIGGDDDDDDVPTICIIRGNNYVLLTRETTNQR